MQNRGREQEKSGRRHGRGFLNLEEPPPQATAVMAKAAVGPNEVPAWLAKKEILPFVYHVMNERRRQIPHDHVFDEWAAGFVLKVHRVEFRSLVQPFNYWSHKGVVAKYVLKRGGDGVFAAGAKKQVYTLFFSKRGGPMAQGKGKLQTWYRPTLDEWSCTVEHDGRLAADDPFFGHIQGHIFSRPRLYWMRLALFAFAVGKFMLLLKESAYRVYAPDGAGYAAVAEDFEQTAKRQRA